ncbi:PREDICTED: olfactory receptor 7G2-like [Capra hircus]|uniref:olfactory receptor 7G2-like n=1 Tax=Capra hircus TaxID=9925 RepID=UPI0008478BA2|nr:PREDICTED: olfactory receptor 7G2-like [Capra hircus]
MELRNKKGVSGFLLMEVTEDPKLQSLVFSLFLSMYLVTVLGNLLIILAINYDPHLHTHMYFFLSKLSFTDICLSTTTIPKMLMNIHTQNQSIAYAGCLMQVRFVLMLASLDSCILSAMAYDLYVAVCHPLGYTVIVYSRLCCLLILLSLFTLIVDALLHSRMLLQLSFCTDLEIPLLFGEVVQVIKLSCSDTLINNILIYFASSMLGGIPVCGIIFSYIQIVSSVLRIASASGKYKVFSTCGSHLSIVSLFYWTAFGVYISSAFTNSPRNSVVVSMRYTVVPQMMNPFIYSLKNRNVKGALKKLVSI